MDIKKEVFNVTGLLLELFALVVLLVIMFSKGFSIFDDTTNTLIFVVIWMILAKDLRNYK